MANEKRRLTDIDALIESTKKFAVNFYVSWTQERVLAWINGAPTVDAVEVVRCEDCKHFRCPIRRNTYCNVDVLTDPEKYDFCSRGERREVD